MKDHEHCWDYYQDLLKAKGFNGITDLLRKHEQAQAQIESLNAKLKAISAHCEGWEGYGEVEWAFEAIKKLCS